MKRLLTSFLTLSSIGLLMLSSCTKNDVKVKNVGSTSSALTTTATTLVLDKTRLNDTSAAITFSFTKPTYTYKAVVNNSLQIDADGDNWKSPASAALSAKGGSQGYSTANFNALLLKLNLPAGMASKVNVRVVNALSSDVSSYSNVVTLTVTPFNLASWLYVVGSFQGWNLAAVDSLESLTSNGIYTGIINFPLNDRDFLILPQKTNYNNKYATNDPINTTSATVAVGAPNNFYSPATAGEYIITLNLNLNTISFVSVDYYSVIGDAALGWNATGDDTEMKFVNDGNNNWVVTLPLVSTGSFKVRQDDAWTNSWGTPKAGTPGDGIANALNSVNNSNNNITIASSGTYKVTFNAPPTVVGSSTPALVTTTYSAAKQ